MVSHEKGWPRGPASLNRQGEKELVQVEEQKGGQHRAFGVKRRVVPRSLRVEGGLRRI